MFTIQERERVVLALLGEAAIGRIHELKVLDIGCGTGGWLLDLIRYGASAERLHGCDLLPDRLSQACRRLPSAVTLTCADGGSLPYPSESFDLVSQFTVFTSILDRVLRRHVAAEMWRVLRVGGALLWYDFRLQGRNDAVRALHPQEVRVLFPDGASLLTSFSLPSLVLLDPAEKQFPYEPAEGAETNIPFTVKGRTDTGNTLECDGKPVPVGEGGLFMLNLDLRDGENSFWLKATSPDGYTRHAQLRISVAFKTVAHPTEEAKRKESFIDKIVNRILEMKLIDIGKETNQ